MPSKEAYTELYISSKEPYIASKEPYSQHTFQSPQQTHPPDDFPGCFSCGTKRATFHQKSPILRQKCLTAKISFTRLFQLLFLRYKMRYFSSKEMYLTSKEITSKEITSKETYVPCVCFPVVHAGARARSHTHTRNAHTRTHTYTHTCKHTHTHTRTHAHSRTHTSAGSVHAHADARTKQTHAQTRAHEVQFAIVFFFFF